MLAGLWDSCLTSDSEGLVCEGSLWVWYGSCLGFDGEGLWVWLACCFTSSGEVLGWDDGLWTWCSSCFTSDEGTVNNGGLWPAPCFTSCEGVVVVGDVVKITMETKDGWSHRV